MASTAKYLICTWIRLEYLTSWSDCQCLCSQSEIIADQSQINVNDYDYYSVLVFSTSFIFQFFIHVLSTTLYCQPVRSQTALFEPSFSLSLYNGDLRVCWGWWWRVRDIGHFSVGEELVVVEVETSFLFNSGLLLQGSPPQSNQRALSEWVNLDRLTDWLVSDLFACKCLNIELW